MKKIIVILVLGLLFFININAEEKTGELNKLFAQLKNTKNLSSAQIIENKIQKIWSIHPSDDRRGFRLTELLNQGSVLINRRELSKYSFPGFSVKSIFSLSIKDKLHGLSKPSTIFSSLNSCENELVEK